jgi:hypothetical protein
MSDNFLTFIPSEPSFAPDQTSRTRAIDYLRAIFPEGEALSDVLNESIQFVDCGANLGSIRCPECGALLDMTWWGHAMDRAHKSGFKSRAARVPCCAKSIDLNKLDYDWSVGFARYLLSARNPGRDVEGREVLFLEGLLNTPLRVIRSRI